MNETLEHRRLSLPVNHLCFCISLSKGVYIITVLSFVLGAGFILLSSKLGEGVQDDLDYVVKICRGTGIIFFAWFLTLLLLMSLNMTLPQKLAVWLNWLLAVWLCIQLVLFTMFLLRSSINGEEDETYMVLSILTTLFAVIVAIYSTWALKNYVKSLLLRDSVFEAPLTQTTQQPLPPYVSYPVSLTSSTTSGIAALSQSIVHHSKVLSALFTEEGAQATPGRDTKDSSAVLQNIYVRKESIPKEDIVNSEQHCDSSTIKCRQTSLAVVYGHPKTSLKRSEIQ